MYILIMLFLRPQYAQYSSSDEDEEIEFSTQHKITNDMLLEREIAHKIESREMDDRRLRRLQQDRISDEDRLLYMNINKKICINQ